MTKNIKIYPNVIIGERSFLGENVIIGEPPQGKKKGEIPTIIGENAYIRSNTVIYAGNIIGDNFQTGHNVVIREDNRIGDNVSIGTGSCVEHHIFIGNGVRLHSQVFIPEYSILEDDSWIGPNVVLTNATYPRSKNVKQNLKGVIIKSKAKVGANSTILPGVIIGKESLIGAGSVVVRDVEDGSIVVGNPARKVNEISNIKEYE